jgi:dihydropteroate synthase
MSPAPREFAGLKLDRPLLMGIVNVTPDSFSDGGRFFSLAAAVAHAEQLIQEGADLLDIGGESSRPGAAPVPVDEELRRVLPLVRELSKRTAVPLSVDTTKAKVARACLDSGASIINDITGLRGDPEMVPLLRQTSAGVVVMHMQGTPPTMQLNPTYQNVVTEIGDFFSERLSQLESEGIAGDRICLDPGIGFGKTFPQTMRQLKNLDEYAPLARPVLVGVSRKGFIGQITGRPRDQRLVGSLAAVSVGLAQGAIHILRVHDVAATKDFLSVHSAIQSADGNER